MNPDDSLDRLDELFKIYKWISMTLPTLSNGTISEVRYIDKPHTFVLKFNDGTPAVRVHMDWDDVTQGAEEV